MQILENTPTRLRIRFPEPLQAQEPQRTLKSRLLPVLWVLAFNLVVALVISWRAPHLSVLRCDHDGETGVACNMEQQRIYGTERTGYARGRVADVRMLETSSEDATYKLLLLDSHGDEIDRMSADKTTDISAIKALLGQSKPGHAEIRDDKRGMLWVMGLAALVMLLGSGFGILRGPADRRVSEINIDTKRKRFRCISVNRSGGQRTTELEWETVLAAVWQAGSKTGSSAEYGVILTDAEGGGARVGPLVNRAQAVELLELLGKYGFSDTPKAP